METNPLQQALEFLDPPKCHTVHYWQQNIRAADLTLRNNFLSYQTSHQLRTKMKTRDRTRFLAIAYFSDVEDKEKFFKMGAIRGGNGNDLIVHKPTQKKNKPIVNVIFHRHRNPINSTEFYKKIDPSYLGHRNNGDRDEVAFAVAPVALLTHAYPCLWFNQDQIPIKFFWTYHKFCSNCTGPGHEHLTCPFKTPEEVSNYKEKVKNKEVYVPDFERRAKQRKERAPNDPKDLHQDEPAEEFPLDQTNFATSQDNQSEPRSETNPPRSPLMEEKESHSNEKLEPVNSSTRQQEQVQSDKPVISVIDDPISQQHNSTYKNSNTNSEINTETNKITTISSTPNVKVNEQLNKQNKKRPINEDPTSFNTPMLPKSIPSSPPSLKSPNSNKVPKHLITQFVIESDNVKTTRKRDRSNTTPTETTPTGISPEHKIQKLDESSTCTPLYGKNNFASKPTYLEIATKPNGSSSPSDKRSKQ